MEEKNNGIVVGGTDSKTLSRRLKFLGAVFSPFSTFRRSITRKQKLVIGLVLIAGAGVLLYVVVYARMTAIQIGSYKVTNKEYHAFISEAGRRKITKSNAEAKLVESYKYQTVASNKKATISDGDLQAAQSELFGDLKITKKNRYYVDRMSTITAVRKKLLPNVEGTLEGAVIEINFSQHIFPVADQSQNAGVGDAGLIEQDRKRAEAYANDLYNRLVNKKISLRGAVEESIDRTDVRPKESLARSMMVSPGQFRSDIAAGMLAWPGVKENLRKLKAGDITKPTVMQVDRSLYPAKPDMVDAYYAIFALTNKSQDSQDFTAYINDLFSKIEVRK